MWLIQAGQTELEFKDSSICLKRVPISFCIFYFSLVLPTSPFPHPHPVSYYKFSWVLNFNQWENTITCIHSPLFEDRIKTSVDFSERKVMH